MRCAGSPPRNKNQWFRSLRPFRFDFFFTASNEADADVCGNPSAVPLPNIKNRSGDVVECHGPPSKSDTIVVFARSSADLQNGGAPPFAILSSVVAIVDGVSP